MWCWYQWMRLRVRALRHHWHLRVSRACGQVSQHAPIALIALYVLAYVAVFVAFKQLQPEIGPDPTKLVIALLTWWDSVHINWLRGVMVIVSAVLVYLVGCLIQFWIDRLPLRQAKGLVSIYRSPSLYFAAVAQDLVDSRLNSYLEFLTSAQQNSGGLIAEGDFWSLHGIVGDVATQLCVLREQQLTTTVSVADLHEKIRELHHQITAAKATGGKFVRYFVCDDFKKTFDLNSYPSEVQQSLVSFVLAHNDPNLKLYFINKDDFLRLAVQARLDSERTDCMMLDNRFVFGIKCDWSNGWPQIHKDRGSVTIFAIHNKYTIAQYRMFFRLLNEECNDDYREGSGDVFEMLRKTMAWDNWIARCPVTRNSYDS